MNAISLADRITLSTVKELFMDFIKFICIAHFSSCHGPFVT